MANTYSWKIGTIIGYPIYENRSNVVASVSYTVIADDGNGNTASYEGIQETPFDNTSTFIPFDQLTEEIIAGWVKGNLGDKKVSGILANLDAKIQSVVNPPPSREILTAPW